jgi:anti-sigma regulatory factor (Ser/Thr protein kinase)
MTALDVTLPRSAEAIALARGLVNEHTGAFTAQQRRDAALIVSELVTNAFLHGIGTISLRIDDQADGLRIEVADEGDVTVAPSPTPGAHGGWGLRIVDQLADDWGVVAGSTKVWFRIGQPPAEH